MTYQTVSFLSPAPLDIEKHGYIESNNIYTTYSRVSLDIPQFSSHRAPTSFFAAIHMIDWYIVPSRAAAISRLC